MSVFFYTRENIVLWSFHLSNEKRAEAAKLGSSHGLYILSLENTIESTRCPLKHLSPYRAVGRCSLHLVGTIDKSR